MDGSKRPPPYSLPECTHRTSSLNEQRHESNDRKYRDISHSFQPGLVCVFRQENQYDSGTHTKDKKQEYCVHLIVNRFKNKS